MPAEEKQESYILLRWVFLRGLGLIHLMAFGSYAFQIIGLNGSHGILPTQQMLQNIASQCGVERFWLFPTITWWNCSDFFLQGITIAGSMLALLVTLGVATGPALILLAVLWLSLVTGGGEFTGFQSDGMLVEATVLSLFITPWQLFEPPWPVPLRLRRQGPPSKLGMWLLRFMLFRIMFISGIVKIASGDPTWRNLTAMDYHFETQPIPTPLAWYAHQLSPQVHKASALFMYISELIAPPLIFTTRTLRLIAFVPMFLLHFGIALTGNYTFLNFLLMLLCLSLLDDRTIAKLLPSQVIKSMEDSQKIAIVDSGGAPTKPSILSKAKAVCFNAAACMVLTVGVSRFVSSFSEGLVPAPLSALLEFLAPFRVADNYGLFAVMTTTRPEIVFQGSDDGITWHSYEFKYKPGDNLKRPPPWVEPHMPRLDWRLWFAAMEPVENSPWVLNLVRRLLDGSPDVGIFFAENPFAEHPPRYVRAFVYDYHFTDYASRRATGNWWRRDNARLYLPPVTLVDDQLRLAGR